MKRTFTQTEADFIKTEILKTHEYLEAYKIKLVVGEIDNLIKRLKYERDILDNKKATYKNLFRNVHTSKADEVGRRKVSAYVAGLFKECIEAYDFKETDTDMLKLNILSKFVSTPVDSQYSSDAIYTVNQELNRLNTIIFNAIHLLEDSYDKFNT